MGDRNDVIEYNTHFFDILGQKALENHEMTHLLINRHFSELEGDAGLFDGADLPVRNFKEMHEFLVHSSQILTDNVAEDFPRGKVKSIDYIINESIGDGFVQRTEYQDVYRFLGSLLDDILKDRDTEGADLSEPNEISAFLEEEDYLRIQREFRKMGKKIVAHLLKKKAALKSPE